MFAVDDRYSPTGPIGQHSNDAAEDVAAADQNVAAADQIDVASDADSDDIPLPSLEQFWSSDPGLRHAISRELHRSRLFRARVCWVYFDIRHSVQA